MLNVNLNFIHFILPVVVKCLVELKVGNMVFIAFIYQYINNLTFVRVRRLNAKNYTLKKLKFISYFSISDIIFARESCYNCSDFIFFTPVFCLAEKK